MYTVIHEFHDLQDGVQTKGGVIYHHYEVGDAYPRTGGPVPSDSRVEDLLKGNNRLGIPLIAETPEAAAQITTSEAETETPSEDAAGQEESHAAVAGTGTETAVSDGAKPEEPAAETVKKPSNRRKKKQ